MKKIVVSLCLLYAAHSCAMSAAGKIIAMATMPITVTGSYHACKTIIDQRKVAAMPDDSPEFKGMSPESRKIERQVLMLNANSFIPCMMDGVIMGLAPISNIVKLTGRSTMGHNVSDMRADEKTGFFAGLATLPNLLLATSLLKKVK